MKYNVPKTDSAQVVVVGGGLGGIAAAVSAARSGADTLLLERNGFLGGVATAGLCCSLFNCFFGSDGERYVGGMAFEIAELLANKAGPGEGWKKHRGHMIFDIELAKLVLLNFLRSEGVRVRLFSPVAGVENEDGRITGIYIAGRNGLELISAGFVVDATGDSDVATLAGFEVKFTEASRASYLFRLGNVRLDEFVDYFRKNPDQYLSYTDVEWSVEDAIAQYDETGTFLFPHGGGLGLDRINRALSEGRFSSELGTVTELNAMQMHGIASTGVVHIITGFLGVDTLDSEALTEKVLEGKRAAFYVADYMKRELPGFENSFVSATADDLGIRISRTVVTERPFTGEMSLAPVRFDDAIGACLIVKGVKMNEKTSKWGVQLLGNDCFEVSLGCLLPKGSKNLIMGAGRSISGKLRVMVDTMVVGQGAGIAAAGAALSGKDFANLTIDDIKDELFRQDALRPVKVN